MMIIRWCSARLQKGLVEMRVAAVYDIHVIRGNAESELLRCLAGEEPGGLSERANELKEPNTSCQNNFS